MPARNKAAMATVVIGGLTFSTFLTLVVAPAVYTLFDDLGRAVTGRRGKKPGSLADVKNSRAAGHGIDSPNGMC